MLPVVLTATISPSAMPACRIAREVLDLAGRAVRAGMSTDDIDRLVHEETVRLR